jgi:hypothetical protein
VNSARDRSSAGDLYVFRKIGRKQREHHKNERNMTRTREHAIRWVFLALVAAAVTACHDGSSDSAAQINVPNVVGDTQAAATTAVTGAGLTVGAVTQASSATVASGNVISETPAAGTSAASGSAVALIVSTGPASVSVPNVVGDTQAAATTALTGAGLTVGTVTQQSSGTVASGDVISESPAASTSVAGGSAVALVVSNGPPTHTIGGTLIGLAPSATVHVFNGADSEAISANGSFTLPTGVVSGGTYSVTVGTPTSTQTCAVQDGSGSVASANVTNVVVYCTYNVSVATLHGTYTTAAAFFGNTNAGSPLPTDLLAAQSYDGAGTISATATVNVAGAILTNVSLPGTYTVTTTDAISSLDGDGGVEGVNGDAAVAVSTTSGTPPTVGIGVLPNANATTDSVNGNYTRVDLEVQLGTGAIEADEGPAILTNGSATGTYTSNTAGTIVTGNPNKGTFTISNGLVYTISNGVVSGTNQGAVSADRDLIVLADTISGDNPSIEAFVLQGTGVTQATFAGVYIVVQYGGASVTSTFGKAITLFAYGDGTYSIIFTKNANGTITNDMDSGTYTVGADGTSTLTDSEGNVYNGAISADGNALILASITSAETPAIFVGVRQ